MVQRTSDALKLAVISKEILKQLLVLRVAQVHASPVVRLIIRDVQQLGGELRALEDKDTLDLIVVALSKNAQYISNHIAYNKEPGSAAFPVALKRFYKPYGIQELLERIIPGQAHANDGLIFTPVDEPYQSGSWQSLLKWKPAELNSVDFRLAPDALTLLVSYGASDAIGDRPHEAFARLDTPRPELIGQIIECVLSNESENTWRYQRVRHDKTIANDRQVTKNILQSIRDRVEKEELIKYLPEIRRRWKEWEAAGLVPK